MAEGPNDIVLQFIPTNPTVFDIRNGRMLQVVEGSTDEIEVYKIYHPSTDITSGTTSLAGTTTFHRMNTATNRWETALELEYRSNVPIVAHFGIEAVHVRDLRKAKKSSSKSRRFQVGGSEYKWKNTDDGQDLYCVDSRNKVVATWSQENRRLWVAEKLQGRLDRVVVTCLLHVWWKRVLGTW